MPDQSASATALAARPPLGVFLRPVLPPGALLGLPGEVAVTLAAATGADPAAVLVTFLTLLGSAAGPQPHAWFGGAQHPGRLFAVLVGDAAAGRKGTALGAVERLFAEADPQWADERVLYGLQSGEAMIDRVADGGTDCRLMVVETEFSRLAETMARTGTLSAQLRNAWDGRVLQRANSRFTRQASQAHVSLLAMITPEELLRQHARLSRAGGLESRLLYAYAAPADEVSPFAASVMPGGLAERVRVVLETSREAVMARADPVSRHLLLARGIQPRAELPVAGEVADDWAVLVKSRLPAPGHGLAALHSRAESQVIRLAALYALAAGDREIRRDHVEAGLAVWSYCARSAEVVFSVPVSALPPAADPRHAAKIVRALHESWPGWVTRDAIGSDVLHGNIAAVAVTAALDDLAGRRLVERRQVPTEGRPRDEYRLGAPQLDLFS